MKGGSIARARIAVLVLFAVLGLALFTGHVLLWRLFSLSLLVLLLGCLWAWLGLRGVGGEVSRSRDRYQVGESFDEEAVVGNTGALPKLMLRVWQNTDLPGHSNRQVVNLLPRGSYRWQTRVYCGHRGRYHLGPLTVEAGDPFGLFRFYRNVGNGQSLMVYPATRELSLAPLLSYAESGPARAFWLSMGPSGSVFRVREYNPGDSLNHIHWRSSAHTGRLMVKDRDIDTFRHIWVVLDMSSREEESTGVVQEQCVTIAASLLKKYLDSGRPVGVIAEGDESYLFPPDVGERYFWRVMEALALVRAEGQLPVDQLIEKERRRFGAGSFVVVVTPAGIEELSACLRRVTSQGIPVAVIVPDGAWPSRAASGRAIGSSTSGGVPAFVVR